MKPYNLLLALSTLTTAVSLPSQQQQLQQQQLLIQALHSPPLPLFNASNTTSSLFALHKALVEIPSISNNEHSIAIWLKAYLESLSYTVELQAVSDPANSLHIRKEENTRYNVFAYPHGADRKTKILLTSHIDTVPPFTNYSTSYTPKTNKLQIHGRGSNDAKASVAAQIIALTNLLHTKRLSATDASLLFVVDEERHGLGMRAANTLNPGWQAVIFGEPTESKLVRGHKGILIFDLLATGHDAHSGYPWLGASAIDTLIAGLVTLRELEHDLPVSKTFGNTTINFGTVSGGAAGNVVAAHAQASIAIRLGGGSSLDVKRRITAAIAKAQEGTGGELKAVFSGNGYDPVKCDTDVAGFEITSVNYGTDVPNLKGDHKRYLFGPGSILSAHSDHESIDAEELADAVDGFERLALGALKALEKDERQVDL
jgi:acetylornithine deacetylase